MSNASALLQDQSITNEIKLEAIRLSFEIATPIAMSASANQAGGSFIDILMKLFEILLPILLEMLKPKI